MNPDQIVCLDSTLHVSGCTLYWEFNFDLHELSVYVYMYTGAEGAELHWTTCMYVSHVTCYVLCM